MRFRKILFSIFIDEKALVDSDLHVARSVVGWKFRDIFIIEGGGDEIWPIRLRIRSSKEIGTGGVMPSVFNRVKVNDMQRIHSSWQDTPLESPPERGHAFDARQRPPTVNVNVYVRCVRIKG